MSASGFTPISLYYSSTASAVPTAGNLVAGELALNTNDGKLYYKNSSGVVTLLAGATSGPAGGSTTQVQYNNAGVLAGITGATTNGTAMTLVAPVLGTPASVVLTNATGLPIATGVSGLGSGVATFLATPSSANLAAALTDETGTGANVFATSPTLNTPVISTITNTGTLTLPTLTGTVGLATRTVQVFTSGSGTYTTPTGCKSIWVRAIGGGGGGAGSGTGSVNGTAGGNTTFGAFTGGGGAPGQANSGVSVAGGTVSGSPTVSIAGGRGGGSATFPVVGYGPGNMGGSGVFGGAGAGGQGTQPADPAVANSGGGGGGAGINPSTAQITGGGGGSGAYFENYYSSPAATYSYGIGAGGTAGTAGTSGYAGGAGGSGIIIVTESY